MESLIQAKFAMLVKRTMKRKVSSAQGSEISSCQCVCEVGWPSDLCTNPCTEKTKTEVFKTLRFHLSPSLGKTH